MGRLFRRRPAIGTAAWRRFRKKGRTRAGRFAERNCHGDRHPLAKPVIGRVGNDPHSVNQVGAKFFGLDVFRGKLRLRRNVADLTGVNLVGRVGADKDFSAGRELTQIRLVDIDVNPDIGIERMDGDRLAVLNDRSGLLDPIQKDAVARRNQFGIGQGDFGIPFLGFGLRLLSAGGGNIFFSVTFFQQTEIRLGLSDFRGGFIPK